MQEFKSICTFLLIFGLVSIPFVSLIPYKTTKVSVHTVNVSTMYYLQKEGIQVKESCGEFIGTTDATLRLGHLIFDDVGSIACQSKRDGGIFFITDEETTTFHVD